MILNAIDQLDSFKTKARMDKRISSYGYARLNDEQIELLLETVSGKKVVDLGAGGMELSRLCARTAASVLAVDSKDPCHSALPSNMSFKNAYFRDLAVEADVAVLSWPINNESASLALIEILQSFDTVVYIGLNDGYSTMCGTPALWRSLTKREPSDCSLDLNSMIVYSKAPRSSPLLEEEKNGLDAYDSSNAFDNLEKPSPVSPNDSSPILTANFRRKSR